MFRYSGTETVIKCKITLHFWNELYIANKVTKVTSIFSLFCWRLEILLFITSLPVIAWLFWTVIQILMRFLSSLFGSAQLLLQSERISMRVKGTLFFFIVNYVIPLTNTSWGWGDGRSFKSSCPENIKNF